MTHTATYSPEDNKLRLYPSCRLDDDEFKRVKAAGFKWAPKQELFVAPMWTPEREDLLIELCGEVGDEDKSLMERQEERAERFGDYSDSRLDDYKSAHAAVKSIADNIPFGQPILVGHHSERRARRDAEKIENGMRKAVKMWETSKYWTDRARSAIAHAKYKERPDVRARRIKGLEAEKRKQERYIADMRTSLASWEKIAALPESEQHAAALRLAGCSDCGYLRLPRKEGDRKDWDQHPTAYDGLSGHYPNLYALRTVAEVLETARASYPRGIAHHERWLQHYENRLTYERAMLAEDGGTAADQIKPEVGGACRCLWGPRGGWAHIKKVNKVTVTVHHKWSSDGRTFGVKVEFDKLHAIMSKAQVDEARASGRMWAENDLGFMLTDDAPKPAPKPIEKPPEDVEAMKATLKCGVKVVSAPQLFPTPPSLADEVVSMADIMDGHRVLEPSGGTGNLIRAIRATGKRVHVVTVEVNAALVETLIQAFPPGVTDDCPQSLEVIRADFLEPLAIGRFDRIVMNPPFENGSDIKHIEQARALLAEGGVLVAICANGPRQNEKLKPDADEWIDLPEGSFASEGTNVRVAMVVFRRPETATEDDPFAALDRLTV